MSPQDVIVNRTKEIVINHRKFRLVLNEIPDDLGTPQNTDSIILHSNKEIARRYIIK